MSYYHLPTSVERQPGQLETKLSDGHLLGAPDGIWTDILAALCGFVPVAETPRPADTATVTYDRTVALAGGVPTVVWTQRNKTAAELAADQATTVTTDLNNKVRTALTANATFLALATPTSAQVVTQVQRLTREIDGLIRMLVGGDLLVANTDT